MSGDSKLEDLSRIDDLTHRLLAADMKIKEVLTRANRAEAIAEERGREIAKLREDLAAERAQHLEDLRRTLPALAPAPAPAPHWPTPDEINQEIDRMAAGFGITRDQMLEELVFPAAFRLIEMGAAEFEIPIEKVKAVLERWAETLARDIIAHPPAGLTAPQK